MTNNNYNALPPYPGEDRQQRIMSEHDRYALLLGSMQGMPIRPRKEPPDGRGGFLGNKQVYTPETARYNLAISRTSHDLIAGRFAVESFANLELHMLQTAYRLVEAEAAIVNSTTPGSLSEAYAIEWMSASLSRMKVAGGYIAGRFLEGLNDR